MSSNLLLLNQAKTEFLLTGQPAELIADLTLLMPSNVTIVTAEAARKFGVIFYSTRDISPRCCVEILSFIYSGLSENKIHS
jgi:hypothetical protein